MCGVCLCQCVAHLERGLPSRHTGGHIKASEERKKNNNESEEEEEERIKKRKRSGSLDEKS